MNEYNYLVVIYINKKGQAKFITAYVVDNEKAAEKIRNSQNGRVRYKKNKKNHWLSGPVVEAFTYPKLLVKDYILSVT